MTEHAILHVSAIFSFLGVPSSENYISLSLSFRVFRQLIFKTRYKQEKSWAVYRWIDVEEFVLRRGLVGNLKILQTEKVKN